MSWSLRKIFTLSCAVFFALSWLTIPNHNVKQSLQPIRQEDASQKRFHLVTNLVLVTHEAYSSNLLYNKTRPPTTKELLDRQHEIDEALQVNLNHPMVAAVHVLYNHPAVGKYLQALKLKNSQKMVLHMTPRNPTVATNLDYIQNYLVDKYVALVHQDNILGKGWEDIKFIILRKRRIMYALTRDTVSFDSSCDAAHSSTCHLGSKYIGSHDVFAFYSHKQLFSSEILKELLFIPSSNGMENVLIWLFQKKLNYKVVNPCLKLKVYHNHCVSIREKGRKSYNNNEKNGLVPITKDLE